MPRICEACSASIPAAEYGVMMDESLWRVIAPRPHEGLFGSGLLCFDCQEARLSERLGITLREAIHDCGIVVYGAPTERMRSLMDADVLAFADEDWADRYHPSD